MLRYHFVRLQCKTCKIQSASIKEQRQTSYFKGLGHESGDNFTFSLIEPWRGARDKAAPILIANRKDVVRLNYKVSTFTTRPDKAERAMVGLGGGGAGGGS